MQKKRMRIIQLCHIDGELEHDLLVRERLVHLAESRELGLNIHLVLRVQENLQDLGAVSLVPNSLASNLRGVTDVL
jgi:hypothetical protein